MVGSTAAHPSPALDRRGQRLARRGHALPPSCTSSATPPSPASPRPNPSPWPPSPVPPATPPPAASSPRAAFSPSSAPPRAGAAAFPPLRGLVLCLAAGAGNAVDALHAVGGSDVTGTDLVDFPPLVRLADPHRLPFSNGAFDLVFSDDPEAISGALFPSRLAAEAERVVRSRGAIALSVDEHLDPAAVAALFKSSCIVDTRDVTLSSSQVRMIILQSSGTTSDLH